MSAASATASAWVLETKERIVAVVRETAVRFVEIVQTPGPSVANPGGGQGGNMPIEYGFLRASLQASLNGPAFVARDRPDGDLKFNWSEGAVIAVIASAGIEDRITFAYTARYSRIMEFRYAFIRLTGQRLQSIVDGVCADLKSRAGG